MQSTQREPLSPVSFFRISPGPPPLSASVEPCALPREMRSREQPPQHGPSFWEASSGSATCAGSETRPRRAVFRQSSTEHARPCQDQRWKCWHLMSNTPRPMVHARQVVPQPCQRRKPKEHAQRETSHSVATAKTTATVPGISKDRHCLQHCSTRELLPLLRDFSKVGDLGLPFVSVVGEMMKTSPACILGY